MSMLGKVLCLLHGALSLIVLAWAIGVVTNRIDWNNPPADSGRDPGLYKRQDDKAAEYKIAVDRAFTRWSGNLNQVLVLEAERYPRRTFYAVHLYVMQTGGLPDATGKIVPVPSPVQNVLNPGPNGYLNVPRDKNGNLNMAAALAFPPYEVRPMVPADSMAGYQAKMEKLVEDIKASQVESAKADAEREKLNKEIVGVTQPMLVKGLRTLITEQKNIMDNAETEDRYVSVFVTNREAEFGLFKKRRDAMLGRVAELNAFMDAQKAGPKKKDNEPGKKN
jgi:hypothetical protein